MRPRFKHFGRFPSRGPAGSALVVALVSLVAMLFLGTAIFRLGSYQLNQVAYNRNRMIALNLAEAGTAYGIWSLYQPGGTGYLGSSGITLSAPDGTPIGSFDVAVSTPTGRPSPHPRQLVAMGRALGLYGQTLAAKGVRAEVHLNLTKPDPSPAFNYGVFTDGPQLYEGGGTTKEIIVNNGSVHSNTRITRTSDRHEIVGAGYNVEAPNWPNYPGHIIFPQLDLDFYRQYAQTDPGSHYYNGTTSITLPQAADDVVLVEGLSGQTVDIDRDATGMLIVIGGNVRLYGNRKFYGLIYTDQSATGQGGGYTMVGTSEVYGAVVARSLSETETTISGTPRVYYDRSRFGDPELVPPYGPNRVTWDSWQEL